MAITYRDLVFDVRRLTRLAPPTDATASLQTAPDSAEERTEFLSADGVGVLLVLRADGTLHAHVYREGPGEVPIAGALIRLTAAPDAAVESPASVSDHEGEANLGPIEQWPRASAATPYRLFIRLPLAGS